jgi:hypothetical protein
MERMKRRAWLALVLLAALALGCSGGRAQVWVPAPKPARGSATFPSNIGDFNGERASPETTAAWLAFLDASFLSLFGASLVLAWIHRRRARSIAAFTPDASLTKGAAVVFGVVEPEPGASPAAVSVEIDQAGTEASNKGNWHHAWNEKARRVSVRPFLVRTNDGTRVRVIPDERVALEDELSRVVRTSYSTRTRIAELLPGESVHITGWLDEGSAQKGTAIYRDAAREPTLRPPRLGRMVISTERPGDTEARRAAFHRVWTIVSAILITLFSGLGFGSAHLLFVDGVVVDAKPTYTRHWQEWVKPKNGSGRWVQHYAVRAEHHAKRGAALPLEDRCTRALHDCVATGRCATVPFVISTVLPSIHQIGRDPTVSPVWIAIATVALVVSWLLYWGTTVSTRPWYARRKVHDTGSGRLPPFITGG